MGDAVLEGFRTQIDALDQQIFALFKARAGVVAQVGEHKRNDASPHRCMLRPGREAKLLRALQRADVAPLPQATLLQMWRLLIAGSLSIEQTLTISVAPPLDFFYLAREYFGATTTITRQPNSLRVMGDLSEGKSLIGLLPWPEGTNDSWWVMLTEQHQDKLAHTPRVFAVAPLFHNSAAPNALLIGDVLVEETGDDETLLVLSATTDTSRARLTTLLEQAGIAATPLASAKVGSTQHYLMRAQGFHPSPPPLEAMRVTWLGSYAKQMGEAL